MKFLARMLITFIIFCLCIMISPSNVKADSFLSLVIASLIVALFQVFTDLLYVVIVSVSCRLKISVLVTSIIAGTILLLNTFIITLASLFVCDNFISGMQINGFWTYFLLSCVIMWLFWSPSDNDDDDEDEQEE